VVDLSIAFWNSFALEALQLSEILKADEKELIVSPFMEVE